MIHGKPLHIRGEKLSKIIFLMRFDRKKKIRQLLRRTLAAVIQGRVRVDGFGRVRYSNRCAVAVPVQAQTVDRSRSNPTPRPADFFQVFISPSNPAEIYLSKYGGFNSALNDSPKGRKVDLRGMGSMRKLKIKTVLQINIIRPYQEFY